LFENLFLAPPLCLFCCLKNNWWISASFNDIKNGRQYVYCASEGEEERNHQSDFVEWNQVLLSYYEKMLEMWFYMICCQISRPRELSDCWVIEIKKNFCSISSHHHWFCFSILWFLSMCLLSICEYLVSFFMVS
jgi:hypothetical protein